MKKLIFLSLSALMALAYRGGGYGYHGGGYGHHGGGMHQGGGDIGSYVASMPKEEVDQTELADLTHMREEEKLARDVYLTLYNKWHLRIFNNIANSEQRHMDAIKALLDKYSLPDPVKDDTVGVFSDPKMLNLYNQLVQEGSKSVTDALKVGATIEDLDIKDLDEALENTNNQDISFVYKNLKKGSENHLRAFVGFLRKYGSDYEPQYISYDYFEEILSTPRQRGMVR
ncbi:MAG: DUF2202 domain-containing protein [Epsilonproteobacteria bacterium]|nr:DUF2202 domain-containing protein [Campylobacterota bacterium]